MGLELFRLLRTVCALWVLETRCLDLPNCIYCRLSKHQAYCVFFDLLSSWATKTWIVTVVNLYSCECSVFALLQIYLYLLSARLSLKSCLVVLHMVSFRAACQSLCGLDVARQEMPPCDHCWWQYCFNPVWREAKTLGCKWPSDPVQMLGLLKL